VSAGGNKVVSNFSRMRQSAREVGEMGASRRRNLMVRLSNALNLSSGTSCLRYGLLYVADNTNMFPNCLHQGQCANGEFHDRRVITYACDVP
jgi:hypothetical protein